MTPYTLAKWNENPAYQEALDTFLKSSAGNAFLDVWIERTPVAPPITDNVNALHIAGRTAQHLADYQLILRMTQKQNLKVAEQEESDYSTSPI
jgi:hypothetical protein